ncbi:MAG: hypothetical protein N2115_05665, partial [bacterium]|nr:hypothetical protein [bacterium]
IVVYSTGSSTSVNIGSASNHARIQGLIFSYGATTGNITLNNANTYINGCLVASGTVTLNNGTLVYDTGAIDPNRIRIYSGFAGGRRVYLPVNWRISW